MKGLFSLIAIGCCVLLAAQAHAQPVDFKDRVPACPPGLELKDGFYFGAGAGYQTNTVENEMSVPTGFTTVTNGTLTATIDQYARGGLVNIFAGYGMYFTGFYNIYLGAEAFGGYNGVESDDSFNQINFPASYLVNQSVATTLNVKYNYGVNLLPGFRVNRTSLVYAVIGYKWSRLDEWQSVINEGNSIVFGVVTSIEGNTSIGSDHHTVGGWHFGGGIESALCEHMSLRAEYTYTSYNSFNTTYINAHIEPADQQFMLGLVYHL